MSSYPNSSLNSPASDNSSRNLSGFHLYSNSSQKYRNPIPRLELRRLSDNELSRKNSHYNGECKIQSNEANDINDISMNVLTLLKPSLLDAVHEVVQTTVNQHLTSLLNEKSFRNDHGAFQTTEFFAFMDSELKSRDKEIHKLENRLEILEKFRSTTVQFMEEINRNYNKIVSSDNLLELVEQNQSLEAKILDLQDQVETLALQEIRKPFNIIDSSNTSIIKGSPTSFLVNNNHNHIDIEAIIDQLKSQSIESLRTASDLAEANRSTSTLFNNQLSNLEVYFEAKIMENFDTLTSTIANISQDYTILNEQYTLQLTDPTLSPLWSLYCEQKQEVTALHNQQTSFEQSIKQEIEENMDKLTITISQLPTASALEDCHQDIQKLESHILELVTDNVMPMSTELSQIQQDIIKVDQKQRDLTTELRVLMEDSVSSINRHQDTLEQQLEEIMKNNNHTLTTLTTDTIKIHSDINVMNQTQIKIESELRELIADSVVALSTSLSQSQEEIYRQQQDTFFAMETDIKHLITATISPISQSLESLQLEIQNQIQSSPLLQKNQIESEIMYALSSNISPINADLVTLKSDVIELQQDQNQLAIQLQDLTSNQLTSETKFLSSVESIVSQMLSSTLTPWTAAVNRIQDDVLDMRQSQAEFVLHLHKLFSEGGNSSYSNSNDGEKEDGISHHHNVAGGERTLSTAVTAAVTGAGGIGRTTNMMTLSSSSDTPNFDNVSHHTSLQDGHSRRGGGMGLTTMTTDTRAMANMTVSQLRDNNSDNSNDILFPMSEALYRAQNDIVELQSGYNKFVSHVQTLVQDSLTFDEHIEQKLHDNTLPVHQSLQTLSLRLDALEKKLNQYSQSLPLPNGDIWDDHSKDQALPSFKDQFLRLESEIRDKMKEVLIPSPVYDPNFYDTIKTNPSSHSMLMMKATTTTDY